MWYDDVPLDDVVVCVEEVCRSHLVDGRKESDMTDCIVLLARPLWLTVRIVFQHSFAPSSFSPPPPRAYKTLYVSIRHVINLPLTFLAASTDDVALTDAAAASAPPGPRPPPPWTAPAPTWRPPLSTPSSTRRLGGTNWSRRPQRYAAGRSRGRTVQYAYQDLCKTVDTRRGCG